MQGGRFADAQESSIQISKDPEMGCAVLQWIRIIDVQELLFQAAKRLGMGCAFLQRG